MLLLGLLTGTVVTGTVAAAAGRDHARNRIAWREHAREVRERRSAAGAERFARDR